MKLACAPGGLGRLLLPVACASSLPASLANLTGLVEVVGFEQTVYEYAPPYKCKELACRPTYETLWQDEKNADGLDAWLCGGLSRDLSTMPFFGARKLEKFWWDMNELTATPEFFIKAVAAWPSLRTLDLYDNRIRVSILDLLPLKNLSHLRQLLIQRNFLYGTIDAAFFLDWPLEWTTFNIALNWELEGCIPPKAIPRWLEFSYAGTKIKVDPSCGSAPSHSSGGGKVRLDL